MSPANSPHFSRENTSSAHENQQYASYLPSADPSAVSLVWWDQHRHTAAVFYRRVAACTHSVQDHTASESQGVGRWRSHSLLACTHFPGLERQMTSPADVSPGVNVFPFKHPQTMSEETHFDLKIFWIMLSMLIHPMTNCFAITARVYFKADNEWSF